MAKNVLLRHACGHFRLYLEVFGLIFGFFCKFSNSKTNWRAKFQKGGSHKALPRYEDRICGTPGGIEFVV
jgi:hypothetical protein